jgi:hypothetical protein
MAAARSESSRWLRLRPDLGKGDLAPYSQALQRMEPPR